MLIGLWGVFSIILLIGGVVSLIYGIRNKKNEFIIASIVMVVLIITSHYWISRLFFGI
jgi:hypothetical protein